MRYLFIIPASIILVPDVYSKTVNYYLSITTSNEVKPNMRMKTFIIEKTNNVGTMHYRSEYFAI